MVIDFHVHCFPDELAKRAVKALEAAAGTPARLDGTVGGIKQSMKRAGISHSVVLSIATKPSQTQRINNWSAEIQGEGIFSFGSIHPEYPDWRQELDRIKKLGLKGIKLHPDYQNFFVDDPHIMPIYEYAFSLGLIVVFHAGVDIGLPSPYHCTPERLLKLVRAFPGGSIVAAHMGGYSYWDDVERLLIGQNIYLDTSYSIARMDEAQARRMINNHDYRKILFATDSPWDDQAEEATFLRKLISDEGMKKAILGENAGRLLEL